MSDDEPKTDPRLHLELWLHAIMANIERLTGLASHWNRRIELTAGGAFGGKTFGCLIRIRANLIGTPQIWPTLLHEAFHCFSVERNADASLRYVGYEEGVVERMQYLFREELMATLGVQIDPDVLIDRDINTAYTEYVQALEAMRLALQFEPKTFYIWLLSTPLEQRWALLRNEIQQKNVWRQVEFRRRWKDWEATLLGEN